MVTVKELKKRLDKVNAEVLDTVVKEFKQNYIKAVNESTKENHKKLDKKILESSLDKKAVETILNLVVKLENDIKAIQKNNLNEDAETLQKFSELLRQVGVVFELFTLMYSQLTEEV